jgi:hypothetical protein
MAACYLPTDLKVRFVRALLDDSQLDEFEKWLYADSELEKYLDPDTYLELISSDFRSEHGRKRTRECIRSILEPMDPQVVDREQVQQLLTGMLDDSIDLLTGLRELSRLHSAGLDFVPILFVGRDDETDSIPSPDRYHLWAPEALSEKLKELDKYRGSILEDCRALLVQLRTAHRVGQK